MKKTIRLQQHEEIERLKNELKNMQDHLESVCMKLNLLNLDMDSVDQSVISAYKLGMEYVEAKHSGKLYEQIKNTN